MIILIFIVIFFLLTKKGGKIILWPLLIILFLFAASELNGLNKEIQGQRYLFSKASYAGVKSVEFKTVNKLFGPYNDRSIQFMVNNRIESTVNYYRKTLFEEGDDILSKYSGKIEDGPGDSNFRRAQLRLDWEVTGTKYYRIDFYSERGSENTKVTFTSSI